MIRIAGSSRALVLAALLAPFAASCGDDGPAAPEAAPVVAAVTISPGPVSLTSIGSSARLAATATDEDGDRMPGARFVWQSSDATVAVVDTAGLVLAKGAGSAIVSAIAGGVPGHVAVTVTQAAVSLAFVSQPADVTAGVALSPALRVEIRDARGARVRGASDAVTLLVEGGDTLSGTTTVNAIDGVATFSGVSLERTGADRTLVAVASELDAATSAPFDVAPGAAAALAFETQPADTVAGDTIRIRIGVRDAFGNAVASDADTIYASLESPADTLQGVVGGTTVDGVLTLDVVVRRAGAHRIRVTAPGRADALSETFSIRAAAPSALNFRTEPTNTQGGHSFLSPVRVEVVDAYRNPTDADDVPVTIMLVFHPEDAPLYGDTVMSTVDGVAAFALSVLHPADDVRLYASAPDLQAALSQAFDVDLRFSRVAAGSEHTCGITLIVRRVYCWGENGEGAVGDGTDENRNVPTPIAVDLPFTEIDAGSRFTCGLTSARLAYCWGSNDWGNLGADSTGDSYLVPLPVAGGRAYTSLSVGARHACALEPSGQAWCWGDNGSGQLGDGTTDDRSAPVPIPGLAFSTITAGDGHTCGLVDGEAYCWGNNFRGQLGDQTTEPRPSPTPVATLDPWTSISAGGQHTCGVTVHSAMLCVGANDDGQLGRGSASVQETLAHYVESDLVPRQIDAGADHTCILTEADTVYCWGDGDDGRLGTGSAVAAFLPVAVAGLPPVFSIAAGDAHTCALVSGSQVFCWGDGAAGQLGDGRAATSYVPVAIRQ